MTKQQIRRRMLHSLRAQPLKKRLAKSKKILAALSHLDLYRRSKTVLCYVDIHGEVQTLSLLKKMLSQKKKVAVPIAQQGGRLVAAQIRHLEKDLNHKGLFGVKHPHPDQARTVRPERLDLVIVPGLAFDAQGQRLGRGGGYYDRYLARVPKSVPRIGLAFGFQLYKKLPTRLHDQGVWKVITEKRIYENPDCR